MANFVGIDLGTTYSAVAVIDESGRPVIVHNQEGSNVTPSVIAFGQDGTVEVGELARRQLGLQDSVYGRFKREMGTDKMYPTPSGNLSPTEFSALVLRKLKEDAEKSIGSITEAVVTVPANFANEAREATLAAAKQAGLNVQYIINEPTAAALHYAHSKGDELSGFYAIYDMGGGTFDVSIVRVTGEDVEVLASNGVSNLGGYDFDRAMQELAFARFESEQGHAPEQLDFPLVDAEGEKRSLSQREKTTFPIRTVQARGNVVVERGVFEEKISALISQAEMLCELTVDEAGIDLGDLNEVILVGGSTRMPIVRKSVANVFGKEPVTTVNVDEAIALGAALYAAYKTDQSQLSAAQASAISSIKLTETTTKSFGTLALCYNASRDEDRLENTILIPKGTKYPKEVEKAFFTVRDNQDAVDCTVTESTTPETDPRFVRVIWEGCLSLPSGRSAGQQVLVKFAYDDNQIMTCTFRDAESGSEEKVDLSMTESKSADGVDVDKFLVR